ncbi:hypothetical protein PIB30_103030, partial [Stylosanthes scabra]|nr:hypothetical protein [Stylosanthes scabra]
YPPPTANYILKRNAELHPSQRVNLLGVVIGDGLIDPLTQFGTIPANAYYVGLINEKQKSELETDQLEIVRLTQIQNWNEADTEWSRVKEKIQNMSGWNSLFDYTLKGNTVNYLDRINQFCNIAEVKKALGVNESQVFEAKSSEVRTALQGDIMKSVKFRVEELLRINTTKVLIYQAQYDLLAGQVQTDAWVKTMKWEGIEEYMNAERKIWKVNGELAGYVQQWKSLSNVVVLGAGHVMPLDQPVIAQAMIQNWILQRGIFGNSPSFSSI